MYQMFKGICPWAIGRCPKQKQRKGRVIQKEKKYTGICEEVLENLSL